MKKQISILLLAGAMALSLIGCSKDAAEENTSGQQTTAAETGTSKEAEGTAPSTVTITHSLGTVEVPVNPEKIAVLDLAVLDIVDALGEGGKVVGIPKKSSISYLDSYVENEDIKNVGSVKEVDMEALNSLQPDVIFIGGRLSSEYENISKIAPTILVSIDRENGYMESFKENVAQIASIFEKETMAEELSDSFDTRVAALKEAAAGKTAIIGMVTSSSLSTLGDDSRCSIIGGEIGFDNIAADVDSTHGDTASFELLLDKNPDYMFILDRDTAIASEGSKTAKEVMENEIVMKTDAYKNENIIYLTPDVWYLAEGGITATDTMLKDLETGLNLNN